MAALQHRWGLAPELVVFFWQQVAGEKHGELTVETQCLVNVDLSWNWARIEISTGLGPTRMTTRIKVITGEDSFTCTANVRNAWLET